MSNLAGFSIDWSSVETVSFEPLEEGSYAAKVIKSEFSKTKKGDQMLNLTFDVIGKNKKIFEGYLMTHSNPKVVMMSLGKLKALGVALDLDFDSLQDTSELHGSPVGIKVKIEKSEQYGDKNKISSFFEYSEDLLDDNSAESSVSVDPIVEEEIVDDEPLENAGVEALPASSPSEIKDMKKAELLAFISDNEIKIEIAGLKLGEVKDLLIEKLYGTEVIEEEEDIIIED